MQQTLPIGVAPKVVIAQINGDFSVRVIEQQEIRLKADGRLKQFKQEGDTLLLIDCDDDLVLEVPADATISADNVSGDVLIQGVRQVELKHAGGDVSLKNIAEVIEVAYLDGDLVVENAPNVRIRDGVGGDASLTNIESLELEGIGGDLSIQNAGSVMLGTVSGDLSARDIAATLRCGNVSGDCVVRGGSDTDVLLGNIGSDCSLHAAAHAQVGNVGGDCSIRDVRGALELGYVGGDTVLNDIGGNVEIGNVGGDAVLKGVLGGLEAGAVSGDLVLRAAFPAGSHTRLNVGGDAEVTLPDEPDLRIRASVGGDISGSGISFNDSGNLLNLVYGDGAAQLELNVGGDLKLSGQKAPRSSSSSSGSWDDFGREMADLGREMSKLGQELGGEMSKLGLDLAREIGSSGISQGARWSDEVKHKIEEQANRVQRRVDEWMRRTEKQAHRADEQASRLNVRINNREWRMDPERLERITEQARIAATEGMVGALEAVERAVKNLGIPTAPGSPPPPARPAVPPSPPDAPVPPDRPVQDPSSAPGNPVAPAPANQEPEATSPTNSPEPTLEQEREAILRMIAEGRISPEEGDLLLESLGG